MNICVFAGSSSGQRSSYMAAAEKLGHAIARRGMGVVYGGADLGLMGAVANATLAAGQTVIGVLPQALASVEIAHPGLTELHIVESMHERKALMAERSDAFIALPGGIGTLEETFEVWTWSQLGIHAKPIGLLNVDGYYDGLLEFLNHVASEGFVKPAHRHMLLANADPDTLVERIVRAEIPTVSKLDLI